MLNSASDQFITTQLICAQERASLCRGRAGGSAEWEMWGLSWGSLDWKSQIAYARSDFVTKTFVFAVHEYRCDSIRLVGPKNCRLVSSIS